MLKVGIDQSKTKFNDVISMMKINIIIRVCIDLMQIRDYKYIYIYLLHTHYTCHKHMHK